VLHCASEAGAADRGVSLDGKYTEYMFSITAYVRTTIVVIKIISLSFIGSFGTNLNKR
jgi:hypothetical protein